MPEWTKDELNRIGAADELNLRSLRKDGTYRAAVTIWVVRVGDNLYVRAVKGRSGPWFRGTRTQLGGRIQSGGVTKEVAFVDETDPGLNEKIDAAYREKYRRYPKEYVDACLTAEARAATIQLISR